MSCVRVLPTSEPVPRSLAYRILPNSSLVCAQVGNEGFTNLTIAFEKGPVWMILKAADRDLLRCVEVLGPFSDFAEEEDVAAYAPTWGIDSLVAPDGAVPSNVRLVKIKGARLVVRRVVDDLSSQVLRVTLSERSPARAYAVGDSLILRVDEDDGLLDIWIKNILPEHPGREVTAGL